MTPERAQEIVDAINNRAFYAMGLHREGTRLGSLHDVSLAEMIAAKDAVERLNEQEREAAKAASRTCTIRVVPAERLIAAAYVLENYEGSNEGLVGAPLGGFLKGEMRVVGVFDIEIAKAFASEDVPA